MSKTGELRVKPGGKTMAKKKKRRKSTPRRATKTARRRSYVTNPGKPPRRRRSYRRNPSPMGNMGELIKLGGGAVAGAIVIPRAVQFVPVDSNVVKNGVGIAAGIALAYFGRRNQLALGAGFGGAAVCARNLVTNMVPMLAGDDFTQDEAESLAAEYVEDMGADMGAEMGAEMSGSMSLNGGAMSGAAMM